MGLTWEDGEPPDQVEVHQKFNVTYMVMLIDSDALYSSSIFGNMRSEEPLEFKKLESSVFIVFAECLILVWKKIDTSVRAPLALKMPQKLTLITAVCGMQTSIPAIQLLWYVYTNAEFAIKHCKADHPSGESYV